ncbi:MAG: T9SS type A sorting domain-containing protein [Candidatus Delongbacteria bacterium]|nr:T9SS type A sorting domain-containing protein [Candidatus Delongbacteria bacterium]MBN2833905.1 T9SS type A sorting domain-containing protein [Candidatus Delongbacteria bacterium]
MLRCVILVLLVITISFAEVSFDKTVVDTQIKGNIGIATAKIDGDEYEDIISVAPDYKKLFWYRTIIGAEEISFERHLIDSDVDGMYLDAMDINEDNIADILCTVPFIDDDKGSIYLYKSIIDNDTISWVRESVTDDFRGAHQVHFADMNNDGEMDVLAVANVSQMIKWWNYNDTEWLGHIVEENFDAQSLELSDFNNDNYPDIVSGLMVAGESEMNIWFSSFQDSLTYTKTPLNSPISGAHWFEIADMNNDNLDDIVCAGYFSGKIACWERDSATTLSFTKKVLVPSILYPLHVAVCDINNDDKNDLFASPHNGNNHQLNYYLNEDGEYIGYTFQNYFNASWQMIPFDADNDGDMDIVCGGYYLPNPSISANLTFFKNETLSDIDEDLIGKDSFLVNNYPNPFNPSTMIVYEVNDTEIVNITIINSNGETILEENLGTKTSGMHDYFFDGNALSTGIYYSKISVGGISTTRKIVLIK